MRTSCFLFAVFLSGCKPDIPPMVESTLLIDKSAEYNGKVVRTCGQLVDDIEQCSIRPKPLPKTGFPFSEIGNVIAIITSDQTCAPGNDHPMQGPKMEVWVMVEGTFYAGERYGHLGGSNYAMGVRDIKPINQPCTK
jgi:hypothetical protein